MKANENFPHILTQYIITVAEIFITVCIHFYSTVVMTLTEFMDK